MHVHVGFAEAAQWLALMVVVGFLWRSVSARLSDSPVGKAMSFIY